MGNWFDIQLKAGAAEVAIYGRIGQTWDGKGVGAEGFLNSLKALGDVSAITVRINSEGGSVFDGVAIHNALKTHKARVTVRVDGLAASAASLIAMAGDKVVMPANALMMIHDPSGGVVGTSGDMRKMADTLDKIAESLVTSYQSKTGQSRDKIKTMMSSETWMNADDALGLGFADEVTDAVKIAARYDLSQYRNAPKNVFSNHAQRATGMKFNIDSLKGMDEVAAEQAMKSEWQTNAELRAEFLTEESAVAYAKAVARGRVRILSGQTNRG